MGCFTFFCFGSHTSHTQSPPNPLTYPHNLLKGSRLEVRTGPQSRQCVLCWNVHLLMEYSIEVRECWPQRKHSRPHASSCITFCLIETKRGKGEETALHRNVGSTYCGVTVLNKFHEARVLIKIYSLGKLSAFTFFLQGFLLLCMGFYL